MSKDYELPDDWEEYSVGEMQSFFDDFRQRVYWYWFQQGNSKKERENTVSEYKVNETLGTNKLWE